MVNPLLVGLKEICIACGQWEFHRVHYDHLKAELQRLTQQQEERESTIREQAARITELIVATNDTDEAELKRLRVELPKSVDAVDPSAGIQERGPRAHEDL